MKYIEGQGRRQLVLYTEMLDELVGEDNPVRVIDEFVNMLDMRALGFTNTETNAMKAGRPGYEPRSMLKLYIYGYFKKIRSSRKLMEACGCNTNVMWLMGRLEPDFRTISDFRKDNAEAIKKVFKAFVKMCIEMGLYSTEVGVQDGSKFSANNSKDNNVTIPKLEKKMEIAEEKAEKYLDELDKCDNEEREESKYTKEEIEEKLGYLRENIGRYNECIQYMKEENISQMSFTDPESRLMNSANGGFDVSYNVQIVVDPESHMVGYVEVTNECNDKGQISPIMEEAKEAFGVEVIESVVDNGYEDRADMLECLKKGTIPHVASKETDEYELEIEYKDAEITEKELNSTKSEDIEKCMSAGVVPNVYKDKGIDISIEESEEYGIEETDEESCFRLNEEGTAVICPNGSVLPKVAELHGKGMTRYTSKSACSRCKEKCTKSAFKQVDLREGQKVVYAKKNRIVKKVKIKLRPDKEKIANRKCVVEHPFGTVKHWYDGSYTLLCGKRKVGADISLLFLAYNLRRAINMVGVQVLIASMSLLFPFHFFIFFIFCFFCHSFANFSFFATCFPSHFRTVCRQTSPPLRFWTNRQRHSTLSSP